MLQSNPNSALQRCKPKLVLALAIPILLILVTLPWPFRGNGHPPSSTQNRMKQWGLVFKMYANASEGGFWPPLARDGQLWTPDLALLMPEYLSAANIDLLVARDHPDRDAIQTTLQPILNQPNPDYDTAAGLMALSFAYVPYLIQNETDFRALQGTRAGGQSGAEQKKSGELYSSNTTPLYEGAERQLFQGLQCSYDAGRLQSKIPVLVEIWNWTGSDGDGQFRGAHVLYMDGHVEHVPLGTFPVVPEVMNVLSGNVR